MFGIRGKHDSWKGRREGHGAHPIEFQFARGAAANSARCGAVGHWSSLTAMVHTKARRGCRDVIKAELPTAFP